MANNFKQYFGAAILLSASACHPSKSPCDDKIVVLDGNGSLQIESQWDACVAKNASKISQSELGDEKLSRIAINLCENYSQRYANALRNEPPHLNTDYINQLVEYKRESLLKIAVSEIHRARTLGCEAK